jgi:hypothetical protein
MKWGALTDDRMKTRVGLGHVYAVSGRNEMAREVLEAYTAEAPDRLDLAPGAAFIYAALGEPDKAFEWLEKAFHNRSGALSTIKVDPRLDPLRSDPRFAELVARMELRE